MLTKIKKGFCSKWFGSVNDLWLRRQTNTFFFLISLIKVATVSTVLIVFLIGIRPLNHEKLSSQMMYNMYMCTGKGFLKKSRFNSELCNVPPPRHKNVKGLHLKTVYR